MKFYDRTGQPIDKEKWLQLCQDPDYRWIARTETRELVVTTVWMGIDLGLPGHTPLPFETGVSDAGREGAPGGRVWRHHTEEEALEFHKAAVSEIEQHGSVSGDWDP